MKHYNRFYLEFGTLIAAKRKELKIKQSDLAKQMNVSTITISRWETGSSRIPNDAAKNLCNLLDLDYDTIVHNANENVSQAKANDIHNVLAGDSIRIPFYEKIYEEKPFTEFGLKKFISISSHLLDTSKKYFAFLCDFNSMAFTRNRDILIFEFCNEYYEGDLVFCFIAGVGCVMPSKVAHLGKYECVGVLRRAVKDYSCQ